MRPIRCAGLAVALLAMTLASWARAADVPYLSGRVVDDAAILGPATRSAITSQLKAHEEKTGDQIAVLTVPTIGNESIDDYALRVFQAWQLGQKGKDNGVLLVVAPKEHRLRIEVGYGLEGTLTDVAASRIIRDVITPAFRAGEFDKGLRDGVDAIVATLEGSTEPATLVAVPSRRAASDSGIPMRFDDPQLPSWPMRILLGGFIFGVIGVFTFLGIVTPGAGWFLYFFLIPFWATFPIVVLGAHGALALLGVYVAGFPIAKLLASRSDWYAKAKHDLATTGKATVGGMVLGGGGHSGGWSSGSGSSGGFSGGGGSSGGGGASGSW